MLGNKMNLRSQRPERWQPLRLRTKFNNMVQIIGSDTISAIATSGPEMQVCIVCVFLYVCVCVCVCVLCVCMCMCAHVCACICMCMCVCTWEWYVPVHVRIQVLVCLSIRTFFCKVNTL